MRGTDVENFPREPAVEMVRRLISLNREIPRGMLIGFIEALGFASDDVRRGLEERRTFNNWENYAENPPFRNHDLGMEVEINYWCWMLEGTVKFLRHVDQKTLEKLVVV